jgi:hypothetical protein
MANAAKTPSKAPVPPAAKPPKKPKTPRAAAAKPAPNPRRSYAANRKRRRARKNPSPRPRSSGSLVGNPPVASDFVQVLTAAGAYALVRVAQRITYSVVQSRWPTWGKWAHAASGAIAAGAAWLFAHKIESLAKYHDGIIVGSGIAAIQGVVVAVAPMRYSWLLTDPRPEDVDSSAAEAAAAPATTVTSSSPTLAATSGDEFSYLEDQMDQVERSGTKRVRMVTPPKPSKTPVAAAMKMAAHGDDDAELDPDLMAELADGEDVDDLFTGSFAPN